MDSIPGLSQIKSLVQLIDGDEEGAAETQANFLRKCVGVSQVTSFFQLCAGNGDAALQTQKEFLGEVNGMVNSVPGVGHVKGGIHYICGDKEGGDAALKASTRTTGTMAGGIGGFLVAGPPGALAGGMAGGTAADCLITGITAAVDDKPDLHGTIGLVRDIFEKDKKAGSVVDLAGMVLFDGLTGMGAGETHGRRRKVKVKINDDIKQKINDPKACELLESNAKKMKGETLRNMPKEVENVTRETRRIESQSGLSKKKIKRQVRAAREGLLHTDSNFHLLHQEDSLNGHVSADVKASANSPRGNARLIMRDDCRNYTLDAKAYTTDHYNTVRVPEYRQPGVFTRACNAYCDLPGGYHGAAETVALAVHRHSLKRRHSHDD